MSTNRTCSNITSNSINKDVQQDKNNLLVEEKKKQLRVEGHIGCKSQLQFQTKTNDEK
jgi:hypothetical protein